jgi:hypothetical protein
MARRVSARRVQAIDATKYKTIGPIFHDFPGAAVVGRSLLAMDGAMRDTLEEIFEAHPAARPENYDETDDDLVFEEVKLEENTPRDGMGRYTFLVGYVPAENVEPTRASREGDAEPRIR